MLELARGPAASYGAEAEQLRPLHRAVDGLALERLRRYGQSVLPQSDPALGIAPMPLGRVSNAGERGGVGRKRPPDLHARCRRAQLSPPPSRMSTCPVM